MILGLLFAILFVAITSLVLLVVSRVAGIDRFEVDLGDAGSRPTRVDSDAVNMLLVGVDDGRGTELDDALAADAWPSGVFRSDVIMVLHIDADREHANVVSIPRDSYVPVEGYGRTKINAAFSRGGPSLLGRTVEDLTGIYLDHVVVADLTGFVEVTDTLGGVDVVIPDTAANMRDGLYPGLQRLNGEQALAYVRERYSLPDGDLDRVQRQQNVLRSLASQVASADLLSDPLGLNAFIGQVAGSLALSESLSTSEIARLGLSLRNLRPADLTFVTVPVTGTPTIDGASVVTVDAPTIRRLFDATAEDELSDYLAQVGGAELLPAPGKVQ